MALKEVRTCDIFDTKADAAPVTVTIMRNEPVKFGPVDMSDRALVRLVKFIERGMSPPTKKAE